MSHCNQCGNPLQPNVKFCSSCGVAVHPSAPSSGVLSKLRVLCILSIIGSILGILRGVVYDSLSGDDEYWRGIAFALLNAGTLIGALMMLISRKRMGLNIYAIFQASYLALSLFTTFVYLGEAGSDEAGVFIVLTISACFILPSAAFLYFYTRPDLKAELKN